MAVDLASDLAHRTLARHFKLWHIHALAELAEWASEWIGGTLHADHRKSKISVHTWQSWTRVAAERAYSTRRRRLSQQHRRSRLWACGWQAWAALAAERTRRAQLLDRGDTHARLARLGHGLEQWSIAVTPMNLMRCATAHHVHILLPWRWRRWQAWLAQLVLAPAPAAVGRLEKHRMAAGMAVWRRGGRPGRSVRGPRAEWGRAPAWWEECDDDQAEAKEEEVEAKEEEEAEAEEEVAEEAEAEEEVAEEEVAEEQVAEEEAEEEDNDAAFFDNAAKFVLRLGAAGMDDDEGGVCGEGGRARSDSPSSRLHTELRAAELRNERALLRDFAAAMLCGGAGEHDGILGGERTDDGSLAEAPASAAHLSDATLDCCGISRSTCPPDLARGQRGRNGRRISDSELRQTACAARGMINAQRASSGLRAASGHLSGSPTAAAHRLTNTATDARADARARAGAGVGAGAGPATCLDPCGTPTTPAVAQLDAPAKSSQVESSQVKSSQAQLDAPAKSSQVESSQVKSSQAQLDAPAKSSQVESSQVKSSQAQLDASAEQRAAAAGLGSSVIVIAPPAATPAPLACATSRLTSMDHSTCGTTASPQCCGSSSSQPPSLSPHRRPTARSPQTHGATCPPHTRSAALPPHTHAPTEAIEASPFERASERPSSHSWGRLLTPSDDFSRLLTPSHSPGRHPPLALQPTSRAAAGRASTHPACRGSLEGVARASALYIALFESNGFESNGFESNGIFDSSSGVHDRSSAVSLTPASSAAFDAFVTPLAQTPRARTSAPASNQYHPDDRHHHHQPPSISPPPHTQAQLRTLATPLPQRGAGDGLTALHQHPPSQALSRHRGHLEGPVTTVPRLR